MPESLPYPLVFLRVSPVVYVGRVERMSTPGADTAFCAPKLFASPSLSLPLPSPPSTRTGMILAPGAPPSTPMPLWAAAMKISPFVCV
ncbi:hypothetical protein ACFVZH_15865 [Streptomyces sp. NPDC059534]|uniref:hypothetical protein n=1 Tax=Streptomyces sp. NPDC059534 TaxID=3346859 RepID=UPI00369A28AD